MQLRWFQTSGKAFLCGLLAAFPLLSEEPANLHYQEHPKTSPLLAAYDFEKPSPSGPDTFWIRQNGDGEVNLSHAFRFNGSHSLRISEVPGNRDFAEFLGYFDERREGAVFVQYYLLLSDPGQRFNFALAGPGWFLNMERNGHAIWLQTADGMLRHFTGGAWQDLFAPQPFAWYFVDFVYHVDSRTYDLAIHEEGAEEPAIDLMGVASVNGHTGSSVKYYSLIGDLEDSGRFDFFVDDLIIATNPAVLQQPFVAPGRRSTFVERLSVGPRPELTDAQRSDLFSQGRRDLTKLNAASESQLISLESIADEAFRVDNLDLAEDIYQRLSEFPTHHVRVLLKLADVKHQRADVEGERELRERFYGRLDYE